MIDHDPYLKKVEALCVEVHELAGEMRAALVRYHLPGGSYPDPKGTALSGELRRRSMDLTRALADLRGRS